MCAERALLDALRLHGLMTEPCAQAIRIDFLLGAHNINALYYYSMCSGPLVIVTCGDCDIVTPVSLP